MAEAKQISHDPFSRVAIMRRVVSAPKQSCGWCGSRRRNHRLFRYWHQRDDAPFRPAEAGQGNLLFCSIGCWRDYWRLD